MLVGGDFDARTAGKNRKWNSKDKVLNKEGNELIRRQVEWVCS